MKVINLKPVKETLSLQGKLFYRESLRAWNTLRLNKTLINEFPMLRERRAKFGYKLVLYRTFTELEKAVRRMRSENEAIPLLMFLQKYPSEN